MDIAARKAVSARILRAREASGLSQKDAAAAAGISPRDMWRYEKKGVVPEPPTLRRIARVVGRTSDELLHGGDHPSEVADGAAVADSGEEQGADRDAVAEACVTVVTASRNASAAEHAELLKVAPGFAARNGHVQVVAMLDEELTRMRARAKGRAPLADAQETAVVKAAAERDAGLAQADAADGVRPFVPGRRAKSTTAKK